MHNDSMLIVVKHGDKYRVKTNGKNSNCWKKLTPKGLTSDKAVFDSKEEAQHYISLTKPQRRRYRKRKLILEAKNRPCLDCGVQAAVADMSFDHIRGKKSFNIGDGPRFGWKVLVEELRKCEVVCRPCHTVREYRRGLVNRLTTTADLSALLFQVAYDAL